MNESWHIKYKYFTKRIKFYKTTMSLWVGNLYNQELEKKISTSPLSTAWTEEYVTCINEFLWIYNQKCLEARYSFLKMLISTERISLFFEKI